MIILTLFATSCEKYGHGYIRGTILETGTNIPIPDALVTFELERRNHDDYPRKFDSLRTDSKGNFILYYKKRRGTYYKFNIEEKNHWYISSGPGNNKEANLTLYMDPIAFVKLRIKKNTSSPTFIEMKGPSYFTSYYRQTTDPFDLSIGVFKVHGNAKSYINYSTNYALYLNMDPINHSEEIFVSKDDTLNYMIQFD